MKYIFDCIVFILLLSAYSHFIWSMQDDILCTPPCRTVVHFISRQSLLFVSSFTLSLPSSLRSSSLLSPPYCHFDRPPSYVVFLSSHHMPIPLQPPFLDFLCDFPHFSSCPSYIILSLLIICIVNILENNMYIQ